MYSPCQELASNLPNLLDFDWDCNELILVANFKMEDLFCTTADKQLECFDCYGVLNTHLLGDSHPKDDLQIFCC